MRKKEQEPLDKIRKFIPTVLTVLDEFDISSKRIEFIAELDCMVFRITSERHPFGQLALRFYPSEYQGVEEVRHQLCWLDSLVRKRDSRSPHPCERLTARSR